MHGVVHFNYIKVGLGHLIDDTRVRRNHIEIILAADTLLDDLHMQQAQKATAETKPQRYRIFRLVNEGCVVEAQLAHTCFQLVIITGINRINSTKDHRTDLLVARQHLSSGCVRMRNSIT